MLIPKSSMVRKSLAIGLVALLLFNAVGYYGLFVGLQYRNDQKIERLADKDGFYEHSLTTIKIPLAMPYASAYTSFERADREISFKGERYRLIKQQHSKDTLYLVCLKDFQGEQIDEAFGDFVKTLTDQPTSSKSAGKHIPSPHKEYLGSCFDIASLMQGWSLKLTFKVVQTLSTVNYTSALIHPPEA